MDWNITLNISEIYEEDVVTVQYISAAFSSFSILPNIFTMFLIIRSKLSSLPEYKIIFHWSIFNIIFILNFIYLYVMPNELIGDEHYVFSYYCSTIIIASTSMFVMLLNIEFVLHTDKLYKRLILLIWLATIILTTLLALESFTGHFELVLTGWAEYLQNVTLGALALLFVLNLFVITVQSGKYKNFKARVMLSIVFIFCYILRWSIGNEYFDDYYVLLLTMISTFLFYSSGLINFVILISFDTNVKDYFALKDKSEIAKEIDF